MPEPGQYGCGIVFLPRNPTLRRRIEERFEQIVQSEGQAVLGWRTVPCNNSMLGDTAKSCEPFMRQVFIRRNPAIAEELAFERKLYVIRKRAYTEIRTSTLEGAASWYIPSLSHKTLVYKGMLTTMQLAPYFPDLGDPLMETALALVHSRFSTNTFPSWDRAHPYRYIAHNGEINTVRGNANWMHAREALFQCAAFGDDMRKILPIINPNGSDSAMFDNTLELLVLAGRPLAARHDDDDSRAVVEPSEHGRREARVLPVPLMPDGAVGRPGLDRVHRWPPHRRRARSQRPAPVALLRDQGRARRDGVRGRRARHSPGGRPAEGPAATGAHVPGRHRGRPHRR